jgi:hypothetical protein
MIRPSACPVGIVRFSLRSLMVFWFLSTGFCPSALAAPLEHYRYHQRTGDSVKILDWRLEVDAPFRLVADIGAERDVTRVDELLATTSWQVSDPVADTELKVWRETDRLHFEGRFKGEPIREQKKIDDAPWYQALSISLRPLVVAGGRTLEFWSLRPDTLEVHKLRVTSQGNEDVEVMGRKTPALKLEIRLTGLKAMFWSCHYWLRQSDGLFLRYEGPSGPPGWPMTRVVLEGKGTELAR